MQLRTPFTSIYSQRGLGMVLLTLFLLCASWQSQAKPKVRKAAKAPVAAAAVAPAAASAAPAELTEEEASMPADMRADFVRLSKELEQVPLLPGFTPEETVGMRQSVNYVLRSCIGMIEQMRKRAAEERKIPVAQEWMNAALDSTEYCGCSAKKMAATMTPEMLRRNAHEEGVEFGKRAGAECVMPRIKKLFPQFCPRIVDQYAPALAAHPNGAAMRKDYCDCINADVQSLSTEEAANYFTPDPKDEQIMQLTGDISALPEGKRMLKSTMICAQRAKEKGAVQPLPAAAPASGGAVTP